MSRKDIYKQVYTCAGQLITEKGYVSPVDLLVRMERISLKKMEEWRFKRIPYLEQVTAGNSTKMNTILLALREFSRVCELKPSQTVYMSWGKGAKQRLRFSRSGHPHTEEMYSTHYVRQKKPATAHEKKEGE